MLLSHIPSPLSNPAGWSVSQATWFEPSGPYLVGAVDGVTEAAPETRADKKNKNSGGMEYCLSGNLNITPPHQYVDPATFEQLLQTTWDGGQPDGFLWFGRVGFNGCKNEALVYTGYRCGTLCGTGTFYILRKEGGVWKVFLTHGIWQS